MDRRLSCVVGFSILLIIILLYAVNYRCLFADSTKCHHQCSDKCRDALCELDGRCVSCLDGYFGESCNKKCPEDCNQCERRTGNCSSCKLGTYLNKNHCESCPAICINCTDTGCVECANGWWGVHCETSCSSSRCRSGTPCRRTDGYCASCVDGKTGSKCIYKCLPNCASCYRYNAARCKSCRPWKYNKNCESDCSETCIDGECDDKNGDCTFGCMDGYWGKRCEARCPPNCALLCDRRNGTCMKGCADGFYGDLCDINCNVGSVNSSMCEKVPEARNSTHDDGISAINVTMIGAAIGFVTSIIICGSAVGVVIRQRQLRRRMAVERVNQPSVCTPEVQYDYPLTIQNATNNPCVTIEDTPWYQPVDVSLNVQHGDVHVYEVTNNPYVTNEDNPPYQPVDISLNVQHGIVHEYEELGEVVGYLPLNPRNDVDRGYDKVD